MFQGVREFRVFQRFQEFGMLSAINIMGFEKIRVSRTPWVSRVPNAIGYQFYAFRDFRVHKGFEGFNCSKGFHGPECD